MTRDEINTVANLIKRMAVQLEQERSAHKTALAEMRASFVARAGADEKLIEGYRRQIVSLGAANDRLNDLLRVERLAHRDEVAALQERLRASIARGDFAQMEVAELKSQTPKQSHPVAVGGYLRRLTGFNTTPAGEIARVTLVDDDDASHLEYEVVRPNGQKGRWSAKGCEPCDPPTEATHDTPTGKQVAEAAVKTEPVAEEIKVGDLVEVVSNRGRNTWLADVGSLGTVTGVEEINESISVHLDDVPGKKNALAGYVSLCDVRKVTT